VAQHGFFGERSTNQIRAPDYDACLPATVHNKGFRRHRFANIDKVKCREVLAPEREFSETFTTYRWP
jgi:hypothetical protein